MPIYEYRCPDCGREFEELVRNAKEKIVCPACGAKKCKRLMSAASFHCGNGSGGDYPSPSGGSGCGSCAGGSCATCGH